MGNTLIFSLLLAAAERIKWPMKVDYESYPSAERRDFENTFTNLLKLQVLYDTGSCYLAAYSKRSSITVVNVYTAPAT